MPAGIYKHKLHSEETKKKIGLASKGRYHTEETKKKMSVSKKGMIFTKQHKRNISLAKKGFHPKTEFKKGCIPFAKLHPELMPKGEKSHLWKGGITPLYKMIRSSLENKQWRKSVLERDNYTCQECRVKGNNLETHHKKRFAVILAEFLKEYDQFSPIEDKETLLRLAIKYQPFWEVDNGKTLCEDCHNNIKKVK